MDILNTEWQICVRFVLFREKPIAPAVPEPKVSDVGKSFRVDPLRPFLQVRLPVIGVFQLRKNGLEKSGNVRAFGLSEEFRPLRKRKRKRKPLKGKKFADGRIHFPAPLVPRKRNAFANQDVSVVFGGETDGKKGIEPALRLFGDARGFRLGASARRVRRNGFPRTVVVRDLMEFSRREFRHLTCGGYVRTFP